MDLTKVSARIRPRLPYEAMDLGFLMVRRWWRELFLIQTLLFGVLGATFYALVNNLSLVMLLLWWFKPIVETFHLQFLGRALFDEHLHAGSILKHKWSILFHELLIKLTWRRFHPLRSFIMPVAELEQLAGRTRLQRIRVLSRANSGSALWLTCLGGMVEIIFTLDVLLVAFALLPKEMTDRIDWNQMLTDEILINSAAAAAIFSMFLVMPFYVASGFALYINRRTWLEGWDIELAFKQLAHRTSKRKIFTTGTTILCILFLMFPAPPVMASPMRVEGEPTLILQRVPPVSPRVLEDNRNTVIEILEGPDFRRMETREVLRPVSQPPEEETPNLLNTLVNWLARVGEWIARTTEALLWASVVFTVLMLARLWPRMRQSSRRKATGNDGVSPLHIVYGPDGKIHALPEQLSTQALRYWQEGNAREALSLLYRGALAHLTDRFNLPLGCSVTEIESVELCQEQCPPIVGTYFNRLTQAWMRIAYGHRQISQQEFEDLLKDWQFFHANSPDVHA